MLCRHLPGVSNGSRVLDLEVVIKLSLRIKRVTHPTYHVIHKIPCAPSCHEHEPGFVQMFGL